MKDFENRKNLLNFAPSYISIKKPILCKVTPSSAFIALTIRHSMI